MPKTCPSCSQPASGRFCSSCGAALSAEVACRECGGRIPPGGRFCSQCGAAAAPPAAVAAASAGGLRAAVPWLVTALAAVILGVVLLYPRFGAEPELSFSSGTQPVARGGGASGAVDLAAMSPREAADRLFNRVMTSHAAGEQEQVQAFLPMALSAYELVPELDADGHYHVGVLQMVAGDAAAARASAQAILAVDADHLFGLFVAAQAEELIGAPERARSLYQRLLEVFDAELALQRPEYTEHAQALEPMRQQAREYLAR